MKYLKLLSIVLFMTFLAIGCGSGGGGGNDGGSGSLEACENSCTGGSGEEQMFCMMTCASAYGDADGDGENIDQDCKDSDSCAYTDNSNGTVTDNATGLIWQQEDDNQEYNWYEASGTSDATNNPGTIDVCGSLTLAGHSDWRLPNSDELMTIVDRSQFGLAIDTTFFPNTNSTDYWSYTTAYTGFAVAVKFTDDEHDFDNAAIKTYGCYVRCVRGGQ